MLPACSRCVSYSGRAGVHVSVRPRQIAGGWTGDGDGYPGHKTATDGALPALAYASAVRFKARGHGLPGEGAQSSRRDGALLRAQEGAAARTPMNQQAGGCSRGWGHAQPHSKLLLGTRYAFRDPRPHVLASAAASHPAKEVTDPPKSPAVAALRRKGASPCSPVQPPGRPPPPCAYPAVAAPQPRCRTCVCAAQLDLAPRPHTATNIPQRGTGRRACRQIGGSTLGLYK